MSRTLSRRNESTIELRPATSEETDWLLQLRMQTMGEHLKASGKCLTEREQLARVLEQFDSIQIISQDNADIGMMKVVQYQSLWKLVQIQLLPAFQNSGLGTKILNELSKNASRQGIAIELTVLKVNPAKRLYDRLGFYVTAERSWSYDMRRDA